MFIFAMAELRCPCMSCQLVVICSDMSDDAIRAVLGSQPGKILSHPPNPGNKGNGGGERDARMTFACGTFLPETSPFTRNRLRDLLPDVDHQICRDGHSMCDSPCFEKEKSAMHV